MFSFYFSQKIDTIFQYDSFIKNRETTKTSEKFPANILILKKSPVFINGAVESSVHTTILSASTKSNPEPSGSYIQAVTPPPLYLSGSQTFVTASLLFSGGRQL